MAKRIVDSIRNILRHLLPRFIKVGLAQVVWRLVYLRHRISSILKFLPIPPLDMLSVEITTFCNLKCAGCIRTVDAKKGQWENEHVSVANFQKLIDGSPRAKRFFPQGIGEPTFHPELPTLIRMARDSKKFGSIEITTNALLKPVEYYWSLFDSGLSYMCISVDTLDPGIIGFVREKTNINKLKSRVEELIKLFPGKVGIRTTIGTRNVNGVGELFALLNDIGPMQVWLQPFFDMGENPNGVMPLTARQEFVANLTDLKAQFDNLEIIAADFIPRKNICPSPWTAPAVSSDGELRPCCIVLHKQNMNVSFGNVYSEPLAKIWRSPVAEQFREDFLKKTPSCCLDCPFYIVRNAEIASGTTRVIHISKGSQSE